jgi:hypothetical protein
MTATWQQYAADFNALTDEGIEDECDQCRRVIDEAESWLEAVAAWEADGKPRKIKDWIDGLSK